MPNFLLRRFFKALTPNYPYPMLRIREELYEVLPEVTIVDRKYYGPLGRAVFINGEGTWINVVDGFIVVKNVRKFGEKDMLELSQLVPIGYRFMDS